MSFCRMFVAGVVVSIGFASTSWCRAQQPIPTGPECYTQAKFYIDLHAAHLRRSKDYEQFTQDPAALKVDGAKFLADYDACLFGLPGSPSWAEVAAAGKSLRDRGSQDPLVWVFYARARYGLDSQIPYEPDLWKCYEQLAAGNYPPLWKMKPIQMLFYDWHRRVPKGKPAAKEIVAQVADAWIREPGATAADRRYRWLWIEDWFSQLSIELKEIVLQTCAKHEAADPWLLNMLSGRYYYDLAWHHRGGGYSNTVTELGARNFQEYLRTADSYLLIAWQIDPKLPEPATLAIRTAMAADQPTASPREWFDRAVAGQMDYSPAYEAYLWNLRPRWGGSHEEMYDFGKECLATKRFDTRVPEEFIEAVFDIHSEVKERHATFRGDEVWADVQAAYTGLLANGDRHYRLTDSAALASQWMITGLFSGHFDDACTVFKKIEAESWKINQAELNRVFHSEISVRAMLAALSGPATDPVRSVLPLLQHARRIEVDLQDESLASIEQVLATDKNALVQNFFSRWRQTIAWEKAFDAGEWVDLHFSPQFTGWVQNEGEWTYQEDGSAVAKLRPKMNRVELTCNAHFTGPFELHAKISLPKGCKKPVAAGFFLYQEGVSLSDEPTGARHFWISPLQRRGGITNQYDHYDGTQAALRLTEPNDVTLLVWPDHTRFLVNGYDLPIEKETAELLRERIRLVTPFHTDPAATVRFEQVRVRRLFRLPPPPVTDDKATVAYYTELLKESPDDLNALSKRGAALISSDLAAAKKDLDRALEIEVGLGSLHVFRGLVGELTGDFATALKEYEEGVRLDDGHIGALRRIAWIRATCRETQLRDGAKAVAAGKRACLLSKNRDFGSLTGLAAAYAEVGQHDLALTTAKKALPLAPPKKKEWTTEFIRRREARESETDVVTGAKKAATEEPQEADAKPK